MNARLTIALPLLLMAIATTYANDKHYAATNLWQAEIGHNNQSSPAMDSNGVIYVTSWLGKIFAINSDGSTRWVFKFGGESASTPAIGANGDIYFGSRDRHIRAVSPAGNLNWKFKTGAWVDASPAIGADGTIYCGSWDKKFYALNPDGTKKWEFATDGPIVSSAAIDSSGVIYFGSHDRKFYALNPDGTKRWEFSAAGAVTSSPAIGSAGELYFTSVDGKLHALNPDGTPRWQLHTGSFTSSSPVLGPDGTIYVSVNQTHCAVGRDGQFKWRRTFWHAQTNYFGEAAAAVLSDETVVFTGGDGYVMTVPGDNGDKEWLWLHWLNGPSFSAPLVSSDGTVYAMGIHRHLYALKRSTPLSVTPWPTFRANPQRTGRVNWTP